MGEAADITIGGGCFLDEGEVWDGGLIVGEGDVGDVGEEDTLRDVVEVTHGGSWASEVFKI